MAGIEVISLINEPTAAACYYASLPNVKISGKILVFDLGGGTLMLPYVRLRVQKLKLLLAEG